jgi:hypothetical protein
MSQADMPSSPIDASVYQDIVGIDIGSQTGSCCVLKPDKRKAHQTKRVSQYNAWIHLPPGKIGSVGC